MSENNILPLRPKSKTLPDWFPLSCYRRDLMPEEWLAHLINRMAVKAVFNNTGDAARAHELFSSLLVEKDYTVEDGKRYLNHEPRWAVSNLSTFEAFYLSALWKPEEQKEWREWATRLADNPQASLGEFFQLNEHGNNRMGMEDALRTLPDEDAGIYQAELLGWRVPVSIDISQDDESLMLAFKIWLAGQRGAEGEQPPPQVDERDLKRWQDYGILAAFDLNLWGQINGHRYTDATIGYALWPEQNPETGFVDTTERYRKTTKPMLARIFDWGYIEKLGNQLSTTTFLKKMHAEMVERGEAKPLPENL